MTAQTGTTAQFHQAMNAPVPGSHGASHREAPESALVPSGQGVGCMAPRAQKWSVGHIRAGWPGVPK